MSAVLRAADISVSFGGVHAVVDVDLEVREGQLVGLIGPNGAGKTTFVDAITGFVPSRGKVFLDDHDLSSLPPHARSRLGLARTWQSIDLFDDLTLLENLTVASRRPSTLTTVRELFKTSASGAEDDLALLEQLGLRERAEDMPGDLSQGQRKLVGVARALAAKPRLVCLDEPAAGLDTQESQELGRKLRAMVDAGTPTLLIDHDMSLVLEISDYVVVLEFGRVIAQGPPDVVRRDRRVIEAYLGSAAAEVSAAELEAAATAHEAAS